MNNKEKLQARYEAAVADLGFRDGSLEAQLLWDYTLAVKELLADQPAATEAAPLDPTPCARCCGTGAEPPPGWVGRRPETAHQRHLADCACGLCMGWAAEPHKQPCGCQSCVAEQAPQGAPRVWNGERLPRCPECMFPAGTHYDTCPNAKEVE